MMDLTGGVAYQRAAFAFLARGIVNNYQDGETWIGYFDNTGRTGHPIDKNEKIRLK